MTASPQPEQAPQLSPGARLGRYEIVAPLGAGRAAAQYQLVVRLVVDRPALLERQR